MLVSVCCGVVAWSEVSCPIAKNLFVLAPSAMFVGFVAFGFQQPQSCPVGQPKALLDSSGFRVWGGSSFPGASQMPGPGTAPFLLRAQARCAPDVETLWLTEISNFPLLGLEDHIQEYLSEGFDGHSKKGGARAKIACIVTGTLLNLPSCVDSLPLNFCSLFNQTEQSSGLQISQEPLRSCRAFSTSGCGGCCLPRYPRRLFSFVIFFLKSLKGSARRLTACSW